MALQRQGTAQAEAALALPLAIRWAAATTAVNGTLVARPVSTALTQALA